MLKRCSLLISYVWGAVLFALLFSMAAHAQAVLFVAGGDDPGLAAAIAALPPGGTVVIEPSGVFTLPVTLGPGDSGKKIMGSPGSVAAFDGTGNPPGTSSFTISGATNVILENLKITMFPAHGVYVTGPNASAKIINCQITKCDTGVRADGTAMAEIEGSRILNNAIGVQLSESAGATIEKTQVRNNRMGVWLRSLDRERKSRAKIWHSMIDNNASDGVRVGIFSMAVLNNNDISFNGANGVIYEFLPTGGGFATGSVSFNTIAFNKATGLSLPPGGLVNVSPGNNTIAGNAPNSNIALPATNQVGP